MTNKTLNKVVVTTTAGNDTYYGTDAKRALETIDSGLARGAVWATPFETITGESIDYNLQQIVKVSSFYQHERPDPPKVPPTYEEVEILEGEEEWDQITGSSND